MKPILCVVDLNESCEKVLEAAAAAAKAYQTGLIVLFSYRLVDRAMVHDISELKSAMNNFALDKFSDLESRILKGRGVPYQFQVEIGFLADRISSYTRSGKVGMVIIGGAQGQAIGENPSLTLERFIASMKLPFLIVPQEANVNEPSY